MCRAYEPVPGSCGLVRRDVTAFLSEMHLDVETVESAVLVANELASNAIEHARTPFRIAVSLLADRLRIEVTDGSREQPVLRPHDPGAMRGRGLQMVDRLATVWSYEIGPEGKTVVAEMGLAGVPV
ncbi:anti-sigma regulatory factor (Ser/Thr protein kinase) [Pseudonocardia sediminis]|uniref:Anti-sigma regulatory factor (Ser/Thr protein kinase) n=1 Tax=Pseudonocardia sediminis TaxID=1397368 RepID=A0A4Q7UVT3_PSEST|nr:ATP-binding protein [Pseudonocardia sediminis]RZT84971.1 anti-sigma regulatory factor (Ser/Thr protein kinase) [Pseudonocardia sediminis]